MSIAHKVLFVFWSIVSFVIWYCQCWSCFCYICIGDLHSSSMFMFRKKIDSVLLMKSIHTQCYMHFVIKGTQCSQGGKVFK